jgi:hypothetical protein
MDEGVLPLYPSAMARIDWTGQMSAASFKLTQLCITQQKYDLMTVNSFFFIDECFIFQWYLAQSVQAFHTHLDRSVQDLYNNLPTEYMLHIRLWILGFRHSFVLCEML